MSVILSCGHRVDDLDEGYDVMVKSTDREFNNAVALMTVCLKCKAMYQREGLAFNTYDDAMEWLHNGETRC